MDEDELQPMADIPKQTATGPCATPSCESRSISRMNAPTAAGYWSAFPPLSAHIQAPAKAVTQKTSIVIESIEDDEDQVQAVDSPRDAVNPLKRKPLTDAVRQKI